MKRFSVVLLLVACLAGCSSGDEIAGLKKELKAAEAKIAAEENRVTELTSRLRVVEEQAAANQATLQDHSELQSELTNSIELHAGSLVRKTEIDKATAGTLTAINTRLSVVEETSTGNRAVLSDVVGTLQEMLK